jgi:hypothetical protein
MPGPPQPGKGRGKTIVIFAVSFVVVFIAVVAARGGSNQPASPAAAPASSAPADTAGTPASSAPASKAAAPASKAAAETVTYVVTGSKADVTYGPSGSSFSHKVPMNVTKPLGSPQYYSISAQLQGGGNVSCELKVNGKTLSKASASGGVPAAP